MFSALKKILGTWTTHQSRKSTEALLFSGSAYFSNRVPKAVSEKWVANGGEISSGTTLDLRARYFFAIDPSEPWATKLFAKSVMVIHAGWIVHCVDEAFQVPITEYILDERFVPEPPYKLIETFPPPIYVLLSEPRGPTGTEFGDTGPMPLQTSDTPSTPTNMPRKRQREQAYFDSPSGSLVFSVFDKGGVPRRPRKQRKLRFDPSFSPEGGRSGKEAVLPVALDWFRDHYEDDEFIEKHALDTGAGAPHGCMTAVRPPDTPDRPFTNGSPSATYRRFSACEHPSKPRYVSSPLILNGKQEKIPPVRTIDFTNLPPPVRRRRFLDTDSTKSRDVGMTLSVVRHTDYKVKTPKKISFANHARVCVYTVSPRRQDVQDVVGVDPIRQPLSQELEDGLEVNGNTRVSSDEIKGSEDVATEPTKDFKSASRMDSDPKIGGDFSLLSGGKQLGNDALTMEEVQSTQCRLLELAAKNGIDSDKRTTLFELGKTYQGMVFRHVW